MTDQEKLQEYRTLIFRLYMANQEAIKTLKEIQYKILTLDEELYDEIFNTKGGFDLDSINFSDLLY